jgi:uncharacterized protein YbjT (DUF2867 family)
MIMVTGASGAVGRLVVTGLLERGCDVLAVSRDPGRAGFPTEARAVAADLSRPETLAEALGGVHTIFLNPAAVERGTEGLLALAVENGVPRVVLLSALTVEYPAGDPAFAARFARLEQLVSASGLASTVLRSGDFAGNVRIWAPQIRAGNIVRGPYGEAATSPIDEQDLAAVATTVLASTDHVGRTYTLTGPESLTQRDKVRIIGEAVGRELRFDELDPEVARATMLGAGVPPEIVARLLGSLADYVLTPGPTTGDVRSVLGRPARKFGDWAMAHSDLFRS